MSRPVIKLLATLFCFCTAQADLQSGLLAHYPFGGNSQDISGNGNHGTDFGAPAFVSGVSGSAMRFDGVDDYTVIPNFDADNFTISYWTILQPDDQGGFVYSMIDQCPSSYRSWSQVTLFHTDTSIANGVRRTQGEFCRSQGTVSRAGSNRTACLHHNPTGPL